MKDIDKKVLRRMEEAYFKGRYPMRNGDKVLYEKNDAVEMGKTAGQVVDILIDKLNIGEDELNKFIGVVNNPSSVDDFKTYNRLMKR